MGKSQKNYMSIKSKLMAAVAMLLVASFMVVSSTYAWFTLSTAPEVTGITTSIGSNGNLEIALLYSKDDANPAQNKATSQVLQNLATGVGSGVGDSFGTTLSSATLDSVLNANKTWGNLIALDRGYGLDTIQLLPAALNITKGVAEDNTIYASVQTTSPLSVPKYGADGRITELNSVTDTGVFNTSSFLDYGTGVRGIGTKSNLSQQEIDFKIANQQYNSAIANANAVANSALGNNAQGLIDFLIDYAALNKTEGMDATALENMVETLTGTGDNGVVDYLEDAQIAIAKVIYAKAAGETLTNYVTPKTVTINADGNLVIDLTGSDPDTYAIPDTYSELKTKLQTLVSLTNAISSALNDANSALTAAGDMSSTTWALGKAVMNPLLNEDKLRIGGKTIAEVQEGTKDLVGTDAKATWVMDNCMDQDSTSVFISLPKDSGVFFNVHQATGSGVSGNGKYMKLVQIYIRTELLAYTTVTNTDESTGETTSTTTSTVVSDAVIYVPAITGVTNASPDLSDLYGYALDFAFRTNAVNSHLLLQTTPVDRIYSENQNSDTTMGSGSTMSFSTTDLTFTKIAMDELMGCIRIVFTDDTGKILAIGGAETKTVDGKTSVVSKQVVSDNKTQYVANIYLYEFSCEESNDNVTLTIGAMKDVDAEGSAQITSLTANEAKAISAYVYLDGEKVTNSMVSATASISGSLNLQFASDAELKPMPYTDLQSQQNADANADADADANA